MDISSNPVTSEDEARAIYEAARQIDPIDIGQNDHELPAGAATAKAELSESPAVSPSEASPPPAESEADGSGHEVWRVEQLRPPRLRDRFARLNRNLDAYREDGTLR